MKDSQGNSWQLAVTVDFYNGSPLLYALDVKGGEDTVSFGQNGAWLAIITEYPPASGLDAATTNTYAQQNLDVVPGGSNDMGWAGPIETKESGELLIAWGFNGAIDPCCGVMQAGPGFTVRGIAEGGFMLEDSWTGGPGLYIASVHWPSYAHWTLGIAAFRMKGKQP